MENFLHYFVGKFITRIKKFHTHILDFLTSFYFHECKGFTACMLGFLTCMLGFTACMLGFLTCMLGFTACMLGFLTCMLGFTACMLGFLICMLGFLTCMLGFLTCMLGFTACMLGFLTCMLGFLTCMLGFTACMLGFLTCMLGCLMMFAQIDYMYTLCFLIVRWASLSVHDHVEIFFTLNGISLHVGCPKSV